MTCFSERAAERRSLHEGRRWFRRTLGPFRTLYETDASVFALLGKFHTAEKLTLWSLHEHTSRIHRFMSRKQTLKLSALTKKLNLILRKDNSIS
jgi:hypothetical protein